MVYGTDNLFAQIDNKVLLYKLKLTFRRGSVFLFLNLYPEHIIMNLTERIKAFSELGAILRNCIAGEPVKHLSLVNHLIESQYLKNPWFTPENVRLAIRAIAEELTFENLTKWISAYPDLRKDSKPSNTGIIMAGNIPLAGFHDFLSVLISGNRVIAKTSSKDPDLIVTLTAILCSINSDFKKLIYITDKTLSGFDAIIATGSDNSSRYFEYYFGKYPNIIRKNRNSISVIDGSETDLELQDLGEDVFTYFGLGCRSISKLYLPEGYDLRKIISNWDCFSGLINHSKYANNYDFSKAIFLINKESFTETGYVLLREDKSISSPVAVLHYEYYNSPDQLNGQIEILRDKIQCITGHNYIPFGRAQVPYLWDYADGIDTLEFLLKKI